VTVPVRVVGRRVLGLALFVLGLWMLSRAVRESIAWPIFQAKSATFVESKNEGAFVAVTGAIESSERVGDPEYLLPKYLWLERVIEAPKDENDNDHPYWVHVSDVGALHAYSARVGDARLAGFQVHLLDARASELPRVRVDATSMRTDSRPVGSSYAKWNEAHGEFFGGKDVVPDGLELAADGQPVRARMWFVGLDEGARVTMVGRQENGRLAPVPIFQGENAVLLLSQKSDLSNIASEYQRSIGARALWGVAIFIGFLLVWAHQWAVFAWPMSFGFAAVMAFFSNGVRMGLANLAIGILGALFVLGAIAIGYATPSAVTASLVIGGATVAVGIARALVKGEVGDLNF